MLEDLQNNFCRAFVFKEIDLSGQTYYIHFEKDEDDNIIPMQILSEEKHHALLNAD